MNSEHLQKIGDVVNSALISRTTRNAIILVVAILIVMILSGILGAFSNGEFQRTYDFVIVDKPLDEIDYSDPVFDDLKSDSRIVLTERTIERFDENLGEYRLAKVSWMRGYNKSYFFESEWFWLETLFNTSLMIVFYIALTNFLISKRQEEDEVYLEMDKEINDIVIKKNGIPAITFEPFLESWNTERKKTQHKANIKYSIAELERKTNPKVRKEFYEIIEGKPRFIIPDKKFTWKQWKHKWYLSRKLSLLSFLEEDYIETNVAYDKIKYFKNIYASFIYSGRNGIHKTTDEYSAIESDGTKYGKDLGYKIALALSITFMFTSILSFTLISVNDNWIIIVYSVLMRLMPLFLQIILSMDYTNHYMKKHAIPNMKLRLNIISMYLYKKQSDSIPEVKTTIYEEIIETKKEIKPEPTPALAEG